MSNVSTRHFGVDAARRVLERTARAIRAHCEDLREDRERRLGRRAGADVEARRAGDPVDGLLWHAGLEQPLAPPGLVAAGGGRAPPETPPPRRAPAGRDVQPRPL